MASGSVGGYGGVSGGHHSQVKALSMSSSSCQSSKLGLL